MPRKLDDAKIDLLLEDYNALAAELGAKREELVPIMGDKFQFPDVIPIEDLGEDLPPEEFEWDGYNAARIDFTKRVPGMIVKLKDASFAEGRAIQDAFQKRKSAADGLTMEVATRLIMGHLEGWEFIGDADKKEWTRVFKTDPPKKQAGTKEWQAWVGELGEKDLGLLTTCITAFRRNLGAEGNE